jgi:hypothetical protein
VKIVYSCIYELPYLLEGMAFCFIDALC